MVKGHQGMLKLFFRLVILAVVIVASHVLLIVGVPQDPTFAVVSEVVNRKQTRLNELEVPTIVFVGGSSLNYGLDGERIESELGYALANTGIHAGLPLAFMLEGVRHSVKPGDIVMLALEYVVYEEFVTYELMRELLAEDFMGVLTRITTTKEIAGIISFQPSVTRENILALLRDEVDQLREACSTLTIEDCATVSVDEYGVLTQAGLDQNVLPPDGLPNRPIVTEEWQVTDNVLKVLDDFVTEMDQKGVDVYVIFPPVPTHMYELAEGRLDSLPETIQSRVDVTVLGTPADYTLPVAYFHNTEYHVNMEGRQAHVDNIIAFLTPHLQPE